MRATVPMGAISSTAAFAWSITIAAVSIGAEASIETASIVGGGTVGPGTVVGGWSDLATAAVGEAGRHFVTTDRGPNGMTTVDGVARRTLLKPDFIPRIIEIEIGTHADRRTVRIVREILLAGRSGAPLSGRPNGIGRDEPILDASGGTAVACDPDGIDPEGLVQCRDGTFWLAEEYRPSLLRVTADGRVVTRYVPRGARLDGADADVVDSLPAVYGTRRDNRGFESLAASPDGTRLWTLLQSPLDNGAKAAVTRAGNVRLLAFDPSAGRAVAEHVYRLGDPEADGYATRGAAPVDGKLCAMAAVDGRTLLVIENDDAGNVRLYGVDVDGATDTLETGPWGGGGSLEEVRDLAAAGIKPVRKSLVADLTPLVPSMRRDVHGDGSAGGALKLEGLAILDPDRIAIVNDNDFGVNAEPGSRCATCVWVIRLPRPLRPAP